MAAGRVWRFFWARLLNDDLLPEVRTARDWIRSRRGRAWAGEEDRVDVVEEERTEVNVGDSSETMTNATTHPDARRNEGP